MQRPPESYLSTLNCFSSSVRDIRVIRDSLVLSFAYVLFFR